MQKVREKNRVVRREGAAGMDAWFFSAPFGHSIERDRSREREGKKRGFGNCCRERRERGTHDEANYLREIIGDEPIKRESSVRDKERQTFYSRLAIFDGIKVLLIWCFV